MRALLLPYFGQAVDKLEDHKTIIDREAIRNTVLISPPAPEFWPSDLSHFLLEP